MVEVRLVLSGSEVLLVRGRDELVGILDAPGQGVLQVVLDLPKMVEELQEEIVKSGETA